MRCATIFVSSASPSRVVPDSKICSNPRPPSPGSQVLAFVDDDCTALSAAITDVGLRGVDILVNAVWPQFAHAVFTRLAFIFAPGVADVFHQVKRPAGHCEMLNSSPQLWPRFFGADRSPLPFCLRQNYTCTERFKAGFAKRLKTPERIAAWRQHPSYQTFVRRWTLPVYYQLRFQEIGGAFENALAQPSNLLDDPVVGAQPGMRRQEPCICARGDGGDAFCLSFLPSTSFPRLFHPSPFHFFFYTSRSPFQRPGSPCMCGTWRMSYAVLAGRRHSPSAAVSVLAVDAAGACRHCLP